MSGLNPRKLFLILNPVASADLRYSVCVCVCVSVCVCVYLKRSWQTLMFDKQPASFIRIVGTHNTANEVRKERKGHHSSLITLLLTTL